MTDFEIKVDMLLSSLEKKKDALECILNISLNQQVVLNSGVNPETAVLFNEMNVTKQEYIDEVLNHDEIFQGVFNGISDGFEKNCEICKEKVATLQALIKEVMEIDIKIRSCEQNNKVKVKMPKPKSEAVKASKANILKQYQKHNKNTGKD